MTFGILTIEDTESTERKSRQRGIELRVEFLPFGARPSVSISRFGSDRRTVLVCAGQGIHEIVRMFTVGDDDVHCARDPGELAGAGIRNNNDVQLRRATVHGGVVLENERSGAAVK
jgi:hypothetical protein